jgi:hypothetical protein
MTRWSAGLITGIIGAVVLLALSFARIPIVSLFLPIIAGAVAGVLVARNPAYAKKAGNGALAGLIGGGIFFIASLIFGVIAANSDIGRSAISMAEATATAQASSRGGNGSSVDIAPFINAFFVVGFCIAGLLYAGLSTAAGAIAGAVAGRNTAPPVQMAPQDRLWTPPTAPPPPPGYPPAGYPPPSPPPGQPPSPSGQ